METPLLIDDAGNVLASIRRKGVMLWAENGHLQYRARKGVISETDLLEIRSLKREILHLLSGEVPPAAANVPLGPRLPSEQASLTFTQRYSWKVHRFDRCPSTLARSALRVIGTLNIELLERVFVELVRRHELLRTKIVCIDGIPTHEVGDGHEFALEVMNVEGASKNDCEATAIKLILEHLTRVDVSVGPLFAGRLLTLDDQDHVLAIFWEHQISDIVSVGILWREIWTMYTQGVRDLSFSLPKIAMQPTDYAVWERKTNPAWLVQHGTYWRERLAGIECTRLFADEEMGKVSDHKWATLRIQLDTGLVRDLREWSRQQRTSLMMSLLTTYAALVARWCNESDVLIWVPMRGRIHPEVENTVGGFACFTPLRVQLVDEDSFIDVMERVVEEYGVAYEHIDFMRAQIPGLEPLQGTGFNWLPFEYATTDMSEFIDVVTLQQFPIEEPLRDDELKWPEDREPQLLMTETRDGVNGWMVYRADRISANTMNRFGDYFQAFARTLLGKPTMRVIDVPCPH